MTESKNLDDKKGILKNAGSGTTESQGESNRKDNEEKSDTKYISNPIAQGYNYAGENPKIRVILALRTERFSNKVVYSTFTEKLKNYVLTTFEEARDIIPMIESRKDTTQDIVNEQPVDLSGEDKKNDVLQWLNREKVRQYYRRITILENNKETLYGLVWGQCSTGLQEVIKADEKYDAKAEKYDVIWILEKVKLVSAGVDEKQNKYCTLVRAITAFSTMRQGASESNDSFRKQVDANALMMKLSGGAHVM